MKELANYVRRELSALADPKKAPAMAAYMKTDMPFYGVQTPARREIWKRMLAKYPADNRRAYEKAVLTLWKLPHREEKYAAFAYASGQRKFITAESIRLYERLVREGAWWDLVDGIATQLVGVALREQPTELWPVMDAWIEDEDRWIRRTAILCQLGFKKRTDHRRLFTYCLRRAHGKEFFIRKAIGWALRDYSYAEPERVRDFLLANRDRLSGLSFREGAKQLRRQGLLPG